MNIDATAPVKKGHCINCGVYTAASYCGRCGRAVYCSRDCQARHWSTHKKTCIDPKQLLEEYDRCLSRIMKKVTGNILIMIAHNDPTCGDNSAITIQLDETIDDFIGLSTAHIVHIARNNIHGETSGRVPITFILKDYKHTIALDMSTMPALNMIKKKYSYIGDLWSVVFEM